MTTKRQAIGYVRVSTEQQGESGQGLENQAALIREQAALRGLNLLGIYEDVASGMGPFNVERREGLQDALRTAQRERVPLLVSSLDRLTREPAVLDGVLKLDGVEVISCRPEEMLSPEVIRQTAARNHQRALNISEGNKRKHAERKAMGLPSGHLPSLPKATGVSRRSRKLRAGEVLDRIIHVLEMNPDCIWKSAGEVADLLNRKGVLSGHRKPFNKSSVRRKLDEARKELEQRGYVRGSTAVASGAVTRRAMTEEELGAALDALDISEGGEAVAPASVGSSSAVPWQRDPSERNNQEDPASTEAVAEKTGSCAPAEQASRADTTSIEETRAPTTGGRNSTPAHRNPKDEPEPQENSDQSYDNHPGYGIF